MKVKFFITYSQLNGSFNWAPVSTLYTPSPLELAYG